MVRYTTMSEVPDSAMKVEHCLEDSNHENYVSFPVTDVIVWYTVREDGEVTKEKFVADDPDCPEDIPIGLDG